MGGTVRARFFGVRGSTPCSYPGNRRYGGNTACVTIERVGEPPIVCDIGTGLRLFGETQPQDGTFEGTALVSHLHWDHVQGLPFFTPVLRPGARFLLYGPVQEDGRSLHAAFDSFMRPPYFPVTLEALPADLSFVDAEHGTFHAGSARITARFVPHNGPTLGFRIEWGGTTIAYIPDHQQPYDGGMDIHPNALELADGVDLLIHDAQYTPAEFAAKRTWGHCTVEYALHVAREAGAKAIALFHHDPVRTDDALDEQTRCAEGYGDRYGLEVIAASEGSAVHLRERRPAH